MTDQRQHALLIQPRDPMVFRDARPFSNDPGARADTLAWPLPQTVAGAVRTHVGTCLDWDWRAGGPEQARALAVHGPLLSSLRDGTAGWEAYLPAPLDAVIHLDHEGQEAVLHLRPGADLSSESGTDLPAGLLPVDVTDDVKPSPQRPWWSAAALDAWLRDRDGPLPASEERLAGPPRETRVHVGIDPTTLTSREGMLFATTGLAFGESVSPGPGSPGKTGERQPALALLCRAASPGDWQPRPAFIALGGERRMARLQPSAAAWPVPSAQLAAALGAGSRLRMVLATPGIFRGGWRPGWLDPASLSGAPPGATGLRLKLVGAAVGRRVPVSGWDLTANDGRGAPRAVRYAAPAGSVYFLQVEAGTLDAATLEQLWLRPMSDDDQDGRDGYGLATWGVW
ncbi:MAG: type III-B CRISPR module-associated Cmr3 family protein [Chloroflexota bacterium]